MGRVLVTRRLPADALDPLRGHEIVQRNDDTPFSGEELVAAVREVDGVVSALTDRIDDDVLSAGERLRVVANVAVGYDNIDVDAARARSVIVCNTPGVLTETTADLTWALILAARRQTSEAESDLRAGRWEGWGVTQYLGHDVHGAILGLIGYGRIGRAVARRATGFGMTVLHHSRTPTGENGWLESLGALLAVADIVSLHVPLTDDTRHLIGAAELEQMKPTSVLVNTSRGAAVDEAALADALEAGAIFGAGLDVYEREPIVDARLVASSRVTLLPHVGSATVATRTRMATMATSAVATVLAGGRPENAVVE